MLFLLFLLAVIGVGLYVSEADERRRFVRIVADATARSLDGLRYFRAPRGAFDAALRNRTPWLLVTPAIVAASFGAFAARLFGAGAIGDPATLVRWGANFGPLTANGEWWRLFSAPFLHDGTVVLLVGMAAVVQVGPILERQMGHSTFAAVFIAAGVFGGLMDLSSFPESVTTSGTSAIFGLYGLLAASIVRGALRPSELSLPLKTIVRLLPVAALFAIAAAGGLSVDLSDKAGLFTGFVAGLVVSRDLRSHKPTVQRQALVTFATLAIAVVAYVPLRGITDIRPELEFLIAVEERTVTTYDAAVRRFREGRNTARAMADLIERSILPELDVARARMSSIGRVPPAHQPIVAAAQNYLRLRDESWRQRVDALGKSDMRLLRKADATERASLAALEQLKAAASARYGA